jgi:adenosine deaminase
MKNYSSDFIKALQDKDISGIRNIPKSDLHNHFPLGVAPKYINNYSNKKIPPPPLKYKNIEEMNRYIRPILRPILLTSKGFKYLVKSALLTAKEDGISLLEMSFDCWFINLFDLNAQTLVNTIDNIHKNTAPDIEFRPEVSIDREQDIVKIEKWLYPLIKTGFFKSIDLAGVEDAKNPEEYSKIYTKAKNAGLKLKAHVGEFLDAKMIQRTCEVLELDEVQHGISVADSKSVMSWIRDNNIRLNICPTSNVKLCRVKNLKEHPIRKLYDYGIKVTINSDDILAFNQTVSEEYLALFRDDVFSAEELDAIRIEGLKIE